MQDRGRDYTDKGRKQWTEEDNSYDRNDAGWKKQHDTTSKDDENTWTDKHEKIYTRKWTTGMGGYTKHARQMDQ